MRFVMMYKPARPETALFSPQQMAKLGQMCAELAQAGVMLNSEGLQPSAKGARVRLSKGTVTVTDGPFAEAKELIAGINVIQAKSKAEAIELAKRFIDVAGDGETEIRQVYEPSDFNL
jgi:hypothetical protein